MYELINKTMSRLYRAADVFGDEWGLQITQWGLEQAIGNRMPYITMEKAAEDWLIGSVCTGMGMKHGTVLFSDAKKWLEKNGI